MCDETLKEILFTVESFKKKKIFFWRISHLFLRRCISTAPFIFLLFYSHSIYIVYFFFFFYFYRVVKYCLEQLEQEFSLEITTELTLSYDNTPFSCLLIFNNFFLKNKEKKKKKERNALYANLKKAKETAPTVIFLVKFYRVIFQKNFCNSSSV